MKRQVFESKKKKKSISENGLPYKCSRKVLQSTIHVKKHTVIGSNTPPRLFRSRPREDLLGHFSASLKRKKEKRHGKTRVGGAQCSLAGSTSLTHASKKRKKNKMFLQSDKDNKSPSSPIEEGTRSIDKDHICPIWPIRAEQGCATRTGQ